MRRNLLRDVLRNPLLIPVTIVVAAGAGFVACRLVGFSTHGQQLRAATIVVMIGAGLGILPSWLMRKSEPATLANLSVAGTLVHTLVTLALGGVWWMSRSMIDRPPFMNWLLVLYWVSLAALATVTISMVKATAPERKRSIASPAPAPARPAPAAPAARTTLPRPATARQTPPPPPRRKT